MDASPVYPSISRADAANRLSKTSRVVLPVEVLCEHKVERSGQHLLHLGCPSCDGTMEAEYKRQVSFDLASSVVCTVVGHPLMHSNGR